MANNQENRGSWYFPKGQDLKKSSAVDAGVETFKDKPLVSLAREVTQNSLDASIKSGVPVVLSFSLFKIESSLIPGYSELKETIIPLAKQTWVNDRMTTSYLETMTKVLEQSSVYVLKISDYHTSGLESSNWQALLDHSGASYKDNEDASGFFGLGKAASFACSDLRMVFYNSLNKEHLLESIGVLNFVSFDENDMTSQGTGYFSLNKKERFNGGVSFDKEVRHQVGTDIYIVGFDLDKYKRWQEEITYSILNNYLLCIENGSLIVKVEDKEISKENLSSYIEAIYQNDALRHQYNDLLAYYDVLNDKDKIVVELPKNERFGLDDKQGKLYLSNKGVNNRKVLMTRKAGMKIFDKTNISGSLKFSGIFYAYGKVLNNLLKELENPSHNNWSEDRGNNRIESKALLDDINRFIKESVINYYQEQIIDSIDAFGVSDFLPSDNGMNENNRISKMLEFNFKDHSLQRNKVSNKSEFVTETPVKEESVVVEDVFVIQERTNDKEEIKEFKELVQSSDLLSHIDNVEVSYDIEPLDIEQVEDSKEVFVEPVSVYENKEVTKVEQSKQKYVPSIGEGLDTKKVLRKRNDVLSRVLYVEEGVYHIKLLSNEDLENVLVNVYFKDEDNHKSKINLVNEDYLVVDHIIQLDKLDANVLEEISIKIDESLKTRLEVEVYATT